MAYQTPITIKSAVDHIRKRQYVLPSIQREFVWDTGQIETLFDSIMRDYPISTFLFWKVEKTKVKDFQFYEFLKKYHEKSSRHNTKIDLTGDEDVIALLDGQQRMTSMYIALTGSYAEKMPYYRKNSSHAYPEKKLYLNLLKPSDDVEKEFDFRFLADDEAAASEGYYWFKCADILEHSDVASVNKYLKKCGLMDTSLYSDEETDFAFDTLNNFYNAVHQKGTISYYLEEGEELDKVLQIFIRINSGGTKLSYSDLLLSIATAQWQEKDAREVIHAFVDEINLIGEGFNFNKDLVLKACLVLSDLDVKFKVDNFNRTNMQLIEAKWDAISEALKASVELVAKFGYSKDSLIANNAIIPVAYFVYKNEFTSDILHSAKREQDRKNIKEWLARVLLKGVFGGVPDNIYPPMRDLINKYSGRFPLEEIIAHYRGKNKSISFSDDDIESLLDLTYGKPKTYCALSLIYEGLNHSFRYHQDHIHPKSFFTKRGLRAKGVSDDLTTEFEARVNKLPNLQLLQATTNTEKNNKLFDSWLNEACSTENAKLGYLRQNFIPEDVSLDFSDFIEFTNQRRDLLKTKFKTILQPNGVEE